MSSLLALLPPTPDNQHPISNSGLTGVAGFIPLSLLPPRLLSSPSTEGFSTTFCPHHFFAYSLISPQSPTTHHDYSNLYTQWWSIHESLTPPSYSLPYYTARGQLLERHAPFQLLAYSFVLDNTLFDTVVTRHRITTNSELWHQGCHLLAPCPARFDVPVLLPFCPSMKTSCVDHGSCRTSVPIPTSIHSNTGLWKINIVALLVGDSVIGVTQRRVKREPKQVKE